MPWGFLKKGAKFALRAVAGTIPGGGLAYDAIGGLLNQGGGPEPMADTGMIRTTLARPQIQQAGLFSAPPSWQGQMVPPVYNRGAMAAGVVPGITAAARVALRAAIQSAKAIGIPRSGVKNWLRSNASVAQILTITGIGVVVDTLIDEIYGPGGNGIAVSNGMIPEEIMLQPTQGTRRTCPRGYVLVKLRNGEAVCMLREYAVKHRYYKPRRKPPISASEMRTLTKARRTANKLERVALRSIELDEKLKKRRRTRR